MTAREVHLVGLGAQTSLGKTMLSSWAAVRAGVPRLLEHPVARDRHGEAAVVSMATYLPDELSVVQRLSELAAQSLEQALLPLSPRGGGELPPLPLFIGVPPPREGLPDTAPRELTARLYNQFGSRFEFSGVQLVTGAHCAGMTALDRAMKLMEAGSSPLCVVGGVDSYMSPETLEWLDREGRLRSSSPHHAYGFFPGEGAGFCLLSLEPEALGLRSLGRIVSLSLAGLPFETNEGIDRTDPERRRKLLAPEISREYDDLFDDESGDAGLALAFEEVCRALPEGHLVTQTICDLNGELARSQEFTRALVKYWDSFEDLQRMVYPCVHWGDVGAASGPLFLGAAACSIVTEPTSVQETLISTMSDEGERYAALVSPPLESPD